MSTEVAEKKVDLTGTQLISLDPKTYVTAVYAPFRERLDAAKAAVADIETVDVSTRETMAVAIKHRATFRSIRIEAENARKLRKAPILDISRLLDGRYKELESEIGAFENTFDAAIVAEQTRRERERAEREAAEAARVAHINDCLAEVNAKAGQYVGKPSAAIAVALDDMRQHDVATWAAEFLPVAQDAKAKAIAALEQLHAGAVAQEQAAAAERKRIEEERAELARLRAEQAERDRTEQARIAEETRKRAEEAAAARAKIEAEERVSRERIEAQERAARIAREAEAAAMQKERDAEAARQRAIAEEQRKKQEAADAEAKAIRDAEEARQRTERERLDKEARALAEQQRQAQEREAAAQREIERAQNEVLDGNAMLAKFVQRFGKRREFAAVVRAINAYLQPGRKEAA